MKSEICYKMVRKAHSFHLYYGKLALILSLLFRKFVVTTQENQFKHMTVSQLKEALGNENHVVLDIRDVASFSQNRIPNAIHLTNESLGDFMRDADFDAPTVVCCYHGISSQQAAQYLISQDFTDVYSLDGGFTEWQSLYPNDTEN